MSIENNNHDYIERRKHVLTDHDINRITSAVYGEISHDIHVSDHVWIGEKRKSQEKCKSVRDSVIKQTLGWGFITTIGALGYLILIGIIKYIKEYGN